MTPTAKLRFVEREVLERHGDYDVARIVKKRVLQQWWEQEDRHDLPLDRQRSGEWCDVPLEKENT